MLHSPLSTSKIEHLFSTGGAFDKGIPGMRKVVGPCCTGCTGTEIRLARLLLGTPPHFMDFSFMVSLPRRRDTAPFFFFLIKRRELLVQKIPPTPSTNK